ncbi:hypothetical protein [Paenibacillus silvae]|uniref:hypothetical protein n=1 Tax=Paenibacillus silvae TaxID=1325358 RepID=UPI00200363BB|nr:hypothetical protein [Paenibacillus silvae]MCK6075398.1 hypothetical protein [Paenibacillus silvae]MCK6149785.1 hypothetical protein [Paenibacillus silvae]MCK6268083.1 hypothetical protein [Paenibacillus silvae]
MNEIIRSTVATFAKEIVGILFEEPVDQSIRKRVSLKVENYSVKFGNLVNYGGKQIHIFWDVNSIFMIKIYHFNEAITKDLIERFTIFLTFLSTKVNCYLLDFNTRYEHVKLQTFGKNSEKVLSLLNVLPNIQFVNEIDKTTPNFLWISSGENVYPVYLESKTDEISVSITYEKKTM